MMTLDDFMKDQMRDPEFAKADEEIQPEMSVIRAIVEAGTSQILTQKELSEGTGIAYKNGDPIAERNSGSAKFL